MSNHTITPVQLRGSNINRGPMRRCTRCDVDKPRGGGVERGPSCWECVDCWKQRRLVSVARDTSRRKR